MEAVDDFAGTGDNHHYLRGTTMSVTLAGAVATACVLGVTHAIEPDHVAGIASLTSRYGDAKLSALVGACFSLGHVALVICWLTIGYILLGHTKFPPVFDTVGTLGVGVLLGILGVALAFGGLKRLFYTHSHPHEHDDATHSHVHAHVPFLGGDHNEAAHSHDHTVQAYLKTGVVGALFTLSPPLSMIVFSSSLLSTGPGLVLVAVVTYAIAITATMSALGAGAGAIFGKTSQLNVRVHGGAQVLTGVLVVVLAGSLLTGAVSVF
jgi:nickel/cobalt exporter